MADFYGDFFKWKRDIDRQLDRLRAVDRPLPVSGGPAPADATFITQTPNGTLTNEQALSTLATGYLKNTTGTGVLSVQAVPLPRADLPSAIAYEDEANTFTGGIQTIQPAVDGTTIFRVLNSAGASILNVDTTNQRIGIGTAAPLHQYEQVKTLTDTSGSPFGGLSTITLDPGSASSATFIARRDSLEVKTGNGQNFTGSLLAFAPRMLHGGTGTVADMRGCNLVARNQSTGTVTAATGAFFQVLNDAAGTITTAYGGRFLLQAANVAGSTITTAYGCYIDVNKAGAAASLPTTYGVYIANSQGTTAAYGIYVSPTVNNYFAGRVGIGTVSPSGALHALLTNATTNAVDAVALFGHDSSGTPLTNFGAAILGRLKSSTTSEQNAYGISWMWVDSPHAHATRQAEARYSAYDSGGAREAIRHGANGTAATLGFYGVAAVVRPAALTQTYSTADRTLAARTALALTDNIGGTVGTTLAAIPNPADTPVDADALRDDLVANVLPKIRDALSSLADQIGKNRVDSEDLAQFTNSIADDLQLLGLEQ